MTIQVFELTNRVAVVTGAAGGIGSAICKQLGGAGAKIVASDVDAAGLQRLADELRPGIQIHTVVGNSSVEGDVIALFKEAEKAFGTPTILVNNAAQGIHTPPQDTTIEEWNRVMDTSLTGYFLNAREFGKRALAARVPGAIVNISSIAGSSGLGRGNFAYSVAKGGVNQITKELAVEWASAKIRVNAIQPCSVNTPGWKKWIESEGPKGKALVDHLLSGIPIGRVAEPSDIAQAVHYLASDGAAMITGAILPVDGGNLALNPNGTIGKY